MPSKRKRRSKIFIPRSEKEFKAERKKLPIFEPQDLRLLVNKTMSGQPDTGVLVAFRRRNDDQLKNLLRCLGVDPSRPDAWLRGFLLLAYYHHGVGHLAWYSRRTNSNAAKWTTTHDLDLLREVLLLKEKKRGLSDRNAIKKLAADRKKRQLFPYRNQERPHAKGTEQQRCEAALRARLQKIKAGEHGRDLYTLMVGVNRDGLGFYERVLHDLDTTIQLRQTVVKNQTTSS